MVPRPKLLGGQSRSATKTLEIVPDSPFIVFYGNNPDASPVELTGNVLLSNAEAVDIRKISIQLEGLQKISWITNAVNPVQMVEKKTIHDESSTLFPPDASMTTTSHRINPGTHKWPFKFSIPQTLPESVEGLSASYIIYNLHATIDRGWSTRALTSSKRIRIVRTLGTDSLETINLEQINEDVWANKISYRITVPRVNYIFGTSITADFVLTPIKKGLTIGPIKLELIETAQVSYQHGERLLRNRTDSTICKIEGDMPDDAEQMVTNIHPESLCDESYHFQMTLPLQRSLRRCRQSVDSDQIKIEHRLKIYVSLHNPEGHTSQLLVKNMVNLFISPRLPVGDDQQVAVSSILEAGLMEEASEITAPPSYDEHQLDLLFSDLDPNGAITPRPFTSVPNSGSNTPYMNSLSRNGSHEDLSSLNAVALSNGTNGVNGTSAASGAAPPSLLHSRLANLQEHGSSHWARNQFGATSGPTTPLRQPNELSRDSPGASEDASRQSSSPPSRVHSGYFHAATTGAVTDSEYNIEALARVPSYNTAVRTPLSSHSSTIALPTYDMATGSARPSPSTSPRLAEAALNARQNSISNFALQPPQQAHAHERSTSRSREEARIALLPPPQAYTRDRSRSRSREGRRNSQATMNTVHTGSSTDGDEGITMAPPSKVAQPQDASLAPSVHPTNLTTGLPSAVRTSISGERERSRTRRPDAVHWA